jgi:pyruvate dehydrogenase E1 component beta subunit
VATNEPTRVGRDVTVVAVGPVVDVCVAAAEELAAHGIEVEILAVDPLAMSADAVLGSVAKTKNAVLVTGGDADAESTALSCRIHEELFNELEHAVQRCRPDADALDDALRRVTTA